MKPFFDFSRGKSVLAKLVFVAVASTNLGCEGLYAVHFYGTPLQSPEAKGAYSPERMCAAIRDGAYSHQLDDSRLGFVFTALGAVLAAGGATLAAEASNIDPQPRKEARWIVGGAAGSAAGIVLTALGVYFLAKSGQERQEYWQANAAVAKIIADRAAYPQSQHRPYDRDAAELDAYRTRSDAQRAAAAASAVTNFVTFKTAEVTSASQAYQTALQKQQEAASARVKAEGDATTKAPALATAKQTEKEAAGQVSTAKGALDTKVGEQRELEAAAILLADESAWRGAVATDRMNAVQAEQAAWNDCQAALTLIAGVDSAANTAAVNALGSSGAAAAMKATTTVTTVAH